MRQLGLLITAVGIAKTRKRETKDFQIFTWRLGEKWSGRFDRSRCFRTKVRVEAAKELAALAHPTVIPNHDRPKRLIVQFRIVPSDRFLLLPVRLGDRRLSRREPRDWHPEGAAAHVVEADLVAEVDARRVAAVLAADAELELAVHRAALLDRHGYELADTGGVERLERVLFENLAREIVGEERVDVVAAEAERHLGEVVGAEAEEVGLGRHLVGREGRAGDLDHRADEDWQLAGELLGRLGLFDRLLGY